MNTGQIMTSSIKGMPKSAVADPGLALVSQDGEQNNVAASFAGQLGLIGMQEKAKAAVNAGITESKLESESVKPFSKNLISDGNQNNPGMYTNDAGVQIVLAAYVHHDRMSVSNASSSHIVDTIQNVSPEQVLDVAVSHVTSQGVEPVHPADFTLHALLEQSTLQLASETSTKLNKVPLQPVDGSLPSAALKQSQQNTFANVETSTVDVVETVAATTSEVNPVSANDAKPHQKLPTEPTQPVLMTASNEAYVQSPVVSIQHPGRTPIVKALPGYTVDAVQNVPLAPQVEEISITLAAQQKAQVAEPLTVQSTPTVSQSLEEIVFSLQPPISVSNANPLEKCHLPQSKPVLRPQIMMLDSDQPKNDSVGPGIAVVLSDEAQPAKPQGDDRVLTVSMQAKSEAGLPQKGLPGIVPTDSATAASVLQPENDDSAKGTVDVHPTALHNTAHQVPFQPVTEARSENGRLNSTLSVSKENIVLQQSLVSANEAPQTSEDSANNGQAQSDSGQTSENQMMTAQIHAQSKTGYHQVDGQVQASNTGLELPGKDLPEQVAHQVRDRLTQHEVKPGNQQITLTLSPENLGELKMNLNLQGQKLSVEIVAENRTIRDAILQHSDSLKDSLARQNISVQSFDVTTNNRGDGNPGHNQNAWKELARQKQEQYWSSGNGYNFPQVDVDSNMMAYKSKNEHAMLDIQY